VNVLAKNIQAVVHIAIEVLLHSVKPLINLLPITLKMRRETSIDIVLESSEVRIKVPCRRLPKLLTRLRRRRHVLSRFLSRSFLTGIRIKWSMWIINLIDGSESSMKKISVIREWFVGCVLF
jgi:hypothetical protein